MQARMTGLGLIQPARISKNTTTSSNKVNPTTFKKETKPPLRQAGNVSKIAEPMKPIIDKSDIKPKLISRGDTELDPNDCAEYDMEYYTNLFSIEANTLPSPTLFEHQANLTPRMRSTVVDWIVEVHRRLKMGTDTLYYTINYIDRCLSAESVDKSRFQLLSCAALLIASKTEEIYPPSISELVRLAGNSFTETCLVRRETGLINTLDFQTYPICVSHFLRRTLLVSQAHHQLQMLSHFISETILLDHEFIGIKPSVLAAAIFCDANDILDGSGKWAENFHIYTSYTISAIISLAARVHASVLSSFSSRFQAVKKKYAPEHMANLTKITFEPSLRIKCEKSL